MYITHHDHNNHRNICCIFHYTSTISVRVLVKNGHFADLPLQLLAVKRTYSYILIFGVKKSKDIISL